MAPTDKPEGWRLNASQRYSANQTSCGFSATRNTCFSCFSPGYGSGSTTGLATPARAAFGGTASSTARNFGA